MEKILQFFIIKNDDFYSVKLAKIIFLLCFVSGSIALFGFLLTKEESFALFGFYLLIYGTILNAFLCLIFLILGIFDLSGYGGHHRHHFKAILILFANIPIAVLYAFLGLWLIDNL